jgi:trk system potassium uptake protein TrkH
MTIPEQAQEPGQRSRYRKATVAMIGLLLVLFSLTMIPPLFVALLYRDGATTPFLGTFVLTLCLGLTCWLPLRRKTLNLRNLDLSNRQGFMVVVGLWFVISLLSALPFMLAVHPHMPISDAVFEATSGLTTTGATVLSNFDDLPHSILYYRAQLNFIGGMGIVVLAVAVLPLFGIGGMQLYRAETPGPMKDEKLTPRIRETAKRLWYIYVGLVLACALAFWVAGMDLFDAVCHSFATLALGGFSTHSDSIGYFHSSAIEIIAGVFSLLAGINFALFFIAGKQLSLRPVLQNAEFQFYIAVLSVLIMVTCLALGFTHTFGAWESFYHGFFQAASIITDNGLTTAGYPTWPPWIVLLLVFGSFFGGCVGSTCGGIKAFRFLLLFRQSAREVRLLIHPSAEIAIKIGGKPTSNRVVDAVWGFYFLYILSYCILSLGVAMTGVDLVTAFGSVAGCLNNMGVGLGDTATTFGVLKDDAKWMLTLAMLLGRLEIFPLLLLFSTDFWR